MDFKRLTSRAKDLVEKRGGTDSLKQDAEELKRIAKGQGSLTDKAKAAAAALKDPGAGAEPRTPAQAMESPQPSASPSSTPAAQSDPADEGARSEEGKRERRKERRERRQAGNQG